MGYKHLCTLVLNVGENFMQRKISFHSLIVFWLEKNCFKSSLDLYFNLSFIEYRIEKKIHTKTVVDVSRGAGGMVFLFSWERLGGG